MQPSKHIIDKLNAMKEEHVGKLGDDGCYHVTPELMQSIVVQILQRDIAVQALENISNAQTVDELQEDSEDEYGLEPEEAIQMAHENLMTEAANALSRIRSLPTS